MFDYYYHSHSYTYYFLVVKLYLAGLYWSWTIGLLRLRSHE